MHKRARPLFEKHIEGEYSGENIKFYDAVQSAQSTASLPGALEGESAKTLVQLGKKLVDEYIKDGSSMQVNIPGPLQKEIVKADKEGDVKSLYSNLRLAHKEIYQLMARDNYPRFIKGKDFEELLSDIASEGASVANLVSEQDLTLLVQDGEGPSPSGSLNA